MKGLYARRPIICVPLTPPQKITKKFWCRQHVAWNPDEWRRVMFTDESRFSLNSDSRRVFVWREVGTRNNPRNFMVWAGIFLGGRTALHIFRQGTLTGQRHRDEILAAYLMPQALEMGENFLLMDDNARPHRAGVVDTFLQNHTIARMNWPARSPDLNPVEHVLDNIGRRISSLQPPPRNTHELETALTQEWALIPQELINSLILKNPRTTLLELEQDTGISKTTIGKIVTEDLKLKKTPAKCIPRFLTNEQNLCRLATCEDMFEMTRTDPE
ncbi:hypothetical protein LAZ67_3002663 [Cordylochernes scorpioides]|uniref:Tc1-like transposase DDE domain-containing protein n=1 Tax=Cordylochernes scorpioides TaxID=51811 RepID=A0ABY6K9F4_9ARAC|nr:hypothetical protein LAZ67_3002663 [Cordylochernes scorpioides]